MVGAGSCGLAVGVAASNAGLSCVIFDRGCVVNSLVGHPLRLSGCEADTRWEAHPYFDQDCVVIGGRNSAAEVSLDLWRAGARVTVVHFLDEFDTGMKPWVRPDIENRIREGSIAARFRTRTTEIGLDYVVLRSEENGKFHGDTARWRGRARACADSGWEPGRCCRCSGTWVIGRRQRTRDLPRLPYGSN